MATGTRKYRTKTYKEYDGQVEIVLEDVIDFAESCTEDEKQQIRKTVGASPSMPSTITIKTLDDELRYRIIYELYNKKSLFELEALVRNNP